jgi:glycosyltransferase involved in cell wall biosynthesis
VKVLLLNSGAIPVPPPYGGGVERLTYQLAGALARRGAEVEFVTSVGADATFPPGVTIVPVPRFNFRIQSSYPLVVTGQAIGAAAVTRAARDRLARGPPDILSVHTNVTARWTVPLARSRGVRSTFTVHNPTPATLRFTSPLRAGPRRISYRLLDEPSMRAADGLIALSPAQSDELAQRFGRSCPPRAVIPPGVDLERFSPASSRPEPRPSRFDLADGYCLFVGRLTQQKGVPYLLEALRGTDLRLIVVGDGPDRSALVRRAEELQVASHVTFVSGVPAGELPELYRHASVLALPSLAEGLPHVGLEGLASGLPLVAFGIPGMTQLVEDGVNGRLIPPGDVAALREGLLRFASEPSLATAAGAASRARAELNFSWEAVADRTLEFYTRLRNDGRSGGNA